MDGRIWHEKFLDLQQRFEEAIDEAAAVTKGVEQKLANDEWPGVDDWTVWRFARSQVERANSDWSEHARAAPGRVPQTGKIS